MKKILFVTRQMDVGGVEVSLINLLNIIDYSKSYDQSKNGFIFDMKGITLKVTD